MCAKDETLEGASMLEIMAELNWNNLDTRKENRCEPIAINIVRNLALRNRITAGHNMGTPKIMCVLT